MKNRPACPFQPATLALAAVALCGALAACGGAGLAPPTPAPQSMQISPPDPAAAIGQTLQLTATAVYPGGAHQDVTGQVVWDSSNSRVAAVTAGGQVTARAAGFATIRATLSGVVSATELAVSGNGGLPAGYAYVALADPQTPALPGAVNQYAIGADGSLLPLAVASVACGAEPVAMVADPSGRYLYVLNRGDATISQYAIGTDGTLQALSPAVTDVIGIGATLSVDPSGRYLYAVIVASDPPGPATTVAAYLIQTDGTLARLAQASAVVAAPASGPLLLDPGGRHGYLAGNAGASAAVTQFSVADSAAFAVLSPPSLAVTASATSLALSSTGQTIYVLSSCVDALCDGQAAPYSIGPSGQLAPAGVPALTGGHVNPVALVTDGSGSNAYLLANRMGVDTNDGVVLQYAVGSGGSLVPLSPATLAVAPGAVSARMYGPQLYVLSSRALGFASGAASGGYVEQFVIDASGVLSGVGTTPLTTGLPTALALVVAR